MRDFSTCKRKGGQQGPVLCVDKDTRKLGSICYRRRRRRPRENDLYSSAGRAPPAACDVRKGASTLPGPGVGSRPHDALYLYGATSLRPYEKIYTDAKGKE